MVTLARKVRVATGNAAIAFARLIGRVDPRNQLGERRGPLRILVDVDTYPPSSRAGSERSLMATLEALSARGHAIRVHVPASQRAEGTVGISVRTPVDRRDSLADYRWSDVVMTQLTAYRRAVLRAAGSRRPLVLFSRLGPFDQRSVPGRPDLLVVAARWLLDAHPVKIPSVVLHPPINPEHFRVVPGDRITMINLSDLKGGPLLGELARRLPEHRFLGVLGEWGDQRVPDPLPPNLEIMENVEDPRRIYERTRILLHPSRQETYGRVGIEAAASGVPVIAHPLPGTREALGDFPIYVDRTEIDGWVSAIRRLDDPEEYERLTAEAKRLVASLNLDGEIQELESALLSLVGSTVVGKHRF